MIKYLFIIASALAVSACGGGGGGGGATWTGAVNGSKYPIVNGTYSLTTSAFSYSCTSGETGTATPISGNVSVRQNINTITLSNGFKGTVELNGTFVTSRVKTVFLPSLNSNAEVTYSLIGTFTPQGWSGNYTLSAAFITLGAVCKYSSTISGSKIISKSELEATDNSHNSIYGENSEASKLRELLF